MFRTGFYKCQDSLVFGSLKEKNPKHDPILATYTYPKTETFLVTTIVQPIKSGHYLYRLHQKTKTKKNKR